jgi:hypothetical protein
MSSDGKLRTLMISARACQCININGGVGNSLTGLLKRDAIMQPTKYLRAKSGWPGARGLRRPQPDQRI